MESMHILLNEAEEAWREEIKRDYPLRSDTPVIRNTKPNGHDWFFSTDLRRIFATISNDENLQRKFQEVVSKYWEEDAEILARETLHYLLFHELYHPLEAPFSVSGEDNDNKKIHQAIRRGVLKAEPSLSPLEQLSKVYASQNGVKDFILDNRFFLDNLSRSYVRKDIIPTWDVLEVLDAPTRTNFYTITRLIYGLLYGPQTVYALFEDKAGKEGHSLAEKALSALLEKEIKLPKTKSTLLDKVKNIFSAEFSEDIYRYLQESAQVIRNVFAGKGRYDGIERLMTVLGPYIEKNMPQGRPDMHGEGAGASPQNILEDLLDDMTPEEQAQFLENLSQEGMNDLQQTADQLHGNMGTMEHSSSINEILHLDLLAIHEYYKRTHPKVKIVGGSKVGETLVVGKREYWDLKSSTVLTEDQLTRVNLQRIDQLQRKTRLPWLIKVGEGSYRLNEYVLKTRDIKDIIYVDAHLDVPEVVEFYVDSSGSMFKKIPFEINDGSSWDMLSHVLYGFIDALQQGSKELHKPCDLRFHNFANQQIDTELINVDQFWKGEPEALRVLFKPENGYDVEDINLTTYNDGKRRTYVVVTDGNLVISGRTERESRKMKQLAKNSQNHVVLFEIGGTYSLGEAVQKDPHIKYYQVHDKEEMLAAGLEVLLTQ